MDERDAFLESTLTRHIEAEKALLDGDSGPRAAIWSRKDPVTLFGAAQSGTGWSDVSEIFARLATAFSDCESYDVELVAAEASGDLAYTSPTSASRHPSTGRAGRSDFA